MRLSIAFIITALTATAAAEDVRPEPAKVAATIDRGLGFLVSDALAWKTKHNCVSCHHAALVVWSMREAKLRGHTVDEPVLAELTKWVAESGEGKTGVPRPEGLPKALNVKAVLFSLALAADPEPDAAAQKGMKLMWGTVKGDQTENGSWSAWPDTRPPIFGGSHDSMTALATLALLPAAAGDEEAKVARDKGVKWLAETKTDDDPQSVAMRLLLWSKLGRPREEIEPLITRIKERQNADGGWSQTKDMESDAWATGQALYALAHAGIKPEDPVIGRAQAFLIKTQKENGSWPMMTRPTKTGDPVTPGQIAIHGGGSAWGVLGLVRSR
ncbi:MAG: terpene cyclase/mutase family protein [Pirellulaceae bacterium]|nr:terpene cyclase/mutase family protein [Pirellulaceae bacterium]